MQIEYLTEFEALAVALNYTRVAKRFNISTSTLSKHVVALEKEIGQQLFYRGDGPVELTPAGRQLYEGISPILAQYRTLMAGLARPGTSERRQLTVHVGTRTPSVMAVIAAACRLVLDEHGIKVSTPAPPYGVKYRTNLKEADAAVLYNNAHVPEECSVVPLGRDPFAAVVPLGHPLAGRETISIRRDLVHTPVVRLKSEAFRTGQDTLFEAFEKCGVEPLCTYSLAASFDDIALYDFRDVLIVPSEALPRLQFVTPATHKVLRFEDEEAYFEPALVWLPGKESAALRAFADAVRTAVAERG